MRQQRYRYPGSPPDDDQTVRRHAGWIAVALILGLIGLTIIITIMIYA